MVFVDVLKSWMSNREQLVYTPASKQSQQKEMTDVELESERARLKKRVEEAMERELELERVLGAASFFLESRDGTNLKVFVKRGKPGPEHKVMFIFAPLGQQDMLTYLPVINHFGDEYTYVSFQYRGFFESEVPRRHRRVSIRDHAEDAMDVLHGAGFDHADVVMAHSMGVQVALEWVLLYPECATALVLMNGSYGTVFNNAFQPFFRIPFAGNFSEWLVKTLVSSNPSVIVRGLGAVASYAPIQASMMWIGEHGNQGWLKTLGGGYLADVVNHYFKGITSSDTSSLFWLRGFQELNAHSVKHLLSIIEHPTLMISGRFDFLTPSWAMEEMAEEMPNATHRPDWFSSHFTVLENPDHVVKEVDKFLRINRVPAMFTRTSSMHFSKMACGTAEE